jgi:hypothetical protein
MESHIRLLTDKMLNILEPTGENGVKQKKYRKVREVAS